MQLSPYLFFDGRTEEALNFYRDAIGADVVMMLRWKDSPDPQMTPPGGDASKVMHARFRVGDTTVMASDGREGQPAFQGFALNITAKNAAEAERLFGALGAGGQVQMPLSKTFFSPSFGMVADRFGVSWMVYVEQ
jgi:PhnB protein